MASKPNSRWNFLQQAVASVESRLDNILADDPQNPASTVPQPSRETSPAVRVSSELSRTSSNASNTNDRLQERLARAMAAKKDVTRTASPMAPAPASDSATSDSAAATTEPVGLLTDDAEAGSSAPEQPPAILVVKVEDQAEPDLDTDKNEQTLKGTEGPQPETQRTDPIVQVNSDSARPSTDAPRDSQTLSDRASQDLARKSEDAMRPAEKSTQEQEDINHYIERIDALQAKLHYLSKEAAESARKAAGSADAGSLERKILEKDAKIALLMDEGQRLSKAEMTHLTVLKKLRAQITTNNKEQDAAKLRAEKAERSLRMMEDRARKAEAASKRAEQSLAASTAGVNDFEAVRKERDALQATLADMKTQISRANARAEAAESKAQADQLEKERRRIADLQDDLTSAKVEREITEEKLKREIRDLQATLEREKEQSRVMESEMLGEQAALESKLESFRVRAEEASSADHGHVQAKLLRQIETLQTQYATASQNWQGIESSLLGRITNLEKERDDIAARETDLRKKLRDATLKLRSADKELEQVQTKFAEMDKSVADAEAEVQRLSRKATQFETELATAVKDVEIEKANAEKELQRRLDEEKAKWTASLQIQRTGSPGLSRKNSNLGFDINHLMSPVQYERPNSRKSSMMPTFDWNAPSRQYSNPSFRNQVNGTIAETPSVVTSNDADDFFANIPPTPHSNNSPRAVNDLISTSTVGAGPSVQLVERMSANVRRLESEKAASKDELTRLTTQRDEARQEVVNMMREVEEKRKLEARLRALEKDQADLSQRHQTTLELLGEKSEQVEELKADIVDVKQMYRQLADTMK
ncbi:TATA element modulatory factor 1 TATA binding-domain-containing protein [Exophiala viscosa]|uniref:TATA element modulatory factor 1 TATA binding-domain-containing protein n=1 Tax=Exophiala viscosa TaxID=2486360 RepID=A0AAN6IB77_9EURO|nr:TATA element modulatory factor 1 TATA binding-domain-containing protein [Exophiala viscosa]